MVHTYMAFRSSARWSPFFFQAEDGIRDWSVTGLHTCALPISYAVFCLRTEEHTSALQSLADLIWRPLLENRIVSGITRITASDRMTTSSRTVQHIMLRSRHP